MAFPGSLIPRAHFVLYAKKTQKRFFITPLIVLLLGVTILFLWFNLKTKIINFNSTDGITMSDFITNLDLHKKFLLLLGGFSFPFDDASCILIKRFAASALNKSHELQTVMSSRHHG